MPRPAGWECCLLWVSLPGSVLEVLAPDVLCYFWEKSLSSTGCGSVWRASVKSVVKDDRVVSRAKI